MSKRSRIAVIGAGISGLSTAYLFKDKHEVHLFECESRLGGHANTVVAGQDKTPVDTGFIVFNELNYPHLTGFFKELGVDVADSEMSLSVRFRKPDFEWGGTTIRTLIAQKRNLLRPKFWSMVKDILRFHRDAELNLTKSQTNGWTIGDLLKHERYGAGFREWYFIPMGAAIWSTPTSMMLDFPAETFLTFCMNHRLLQVNDRPVWKTVRGGSIEYVKKVVSHLQHIHSGVPVQKVVRHANGVAVYWNGKRHEFDAVIFATHPPETLAMLVDASGEERVVLESFKFQRNIAQLHSDESVMPKRKSLWSAWNFHQSQDGLNQSAISLSYWMNRLQPLTTKQTMIVSLNAVQTPMHLHKEVVYEHPLFSSRAIGAQKQLAAIQGQGAVYHCGAWTRYGFHEDGILSAVLLAQLWNISVPWLSRSDQAAPANEESEETQNAAMTAAQGA